MLLSLILILIIAAGGLALTYLFAEDETFLWRVSAGNVIGSAVFGSLGFVLANFFGLSVITVLIPLIITISPLILFAKKDFQKRFRRDWIKAKGKLQGANARKAFRFLYYAFFFFLFWIFFERAMFETAQGIFTGGSNNLGDLPFHLGAIFSFTEGQNFPPQNPSFSGAKFTYPFVADFLTACFMRFGADVKNAMLVQNVAWAFSLLVVLERFVFKMTENRLAGKIAPVILFFSGGLGFVWFANDFWIQEKGFIDFIYNLPRDYTIGENFRWGNSLITLFLTQRSLLLGMPLTLIALTKIYQIFVNGGETARQREGETFIAQSLHRAVSPSLFVGLLAGSLPLIHLHSLFVLFIVGVFVLILKPEKWRAWIAFGVGVAIIAIPELIWAMTGSASHTSEFVAFHFGWDLRDDRFIWFWLKNTGIFIPLLIFGLVQSSKFKVQGSETEKKTRHSALGTQQLLFYLPFLFCFVITNTMKFAPWEWDNIKILIYWFVGSLPFAAVALAWIYNQGKIFKFVAVGCLIVLVFSGALDVWRTASGQINYKVFDADAVKVAEQIKRKTAPNALFLNAPTYNSAVVLTGRRSLMRYTGHLSSHGIDYAGRETDVKRIYEGNATSDILMRKYDIEYVLISPEEKSSLTVNEQYFQKFPVIAESGQYRVYKVK